MKNQLNNFRQFGVEHRNQSSINMRKVWGSHLTFYDSFCKQSFTSCQVFAKQLIHDVLDIWNIHFVDDTIDAFSESLPSYFLVFRRILVFGLKFTHESLHFERRYVNTNLYNSFLLFLSFWKLLNKFWFLQKFFQSSRYFWDNLKPFLFLFIFLEIFLISLSNFLSIICSGFLFL